MKFRSLEILIASLLLAFFHGVAHAAPSDAPIRIIVPSPAGGQSDNLARALSGPLHEYTGRPVIVENRAGASMLIGMQACQSALPDGSTYCIAPPDALSYNPHVFKKLPYDPKAFVGISNLGWTNGFIVVSGRSRTKTIAELVQAANADPSRFNWATWGDASMPDVFLRWIKLKTGAKIESVPYKGASPGNLAVITGEAQVTYMGVGVATPYIDAGSVRPIALTGKKRQDRFANVPTLAELGLDPGLPGYFGLYAPPKTPQVIADHMHDLVERALDTPALREFYVKYTLDRASGSAKDFGEFLIRDRQRAGEVFKTLGVKPSDSGSPEKP